MTRTYYKGKYGKALDYVILLHRAYIFAENPTFDNDPKNKVNFTREWKVLLRVAWEAFEDLKLTLQDDMIFFHTHKYGMAILVYSDSCLFISSPILF